MKKVEGVSLFRVIYFSHKGDIRFLFCCCTRYNYLYKYIEIGLINTGFGMSIIQRLKNSTYIAVKHLKEDHLFRERPQFLFHFPVRQLITYTWVDFGEIGIIFRIIINRKILKLP